MYTHRRGRAHSHRLSRLGTPKQTQHTQAELSDDYTSTILRLLSAVLSHCHSQDHVHTKPCLLQVIMPPSKASSRAAGYGARQAPPTPVKPQAHKAQRKEWSCTKDCNVQFRGISPRQRYQLAPALPSADMQRYRHSKQGQAARAARNRSPLVASLHSAGRATHKTDASGAHSRSEQAAPSCCSASGTVQQQRSADLKQVR